MANFTAFKEYEPSQVAAIIFIFVFLVEFVAHSWQSIRAKAWYMWLLVLSTLLEFIGYALREYCIHNRHVMTPYILSQVFIVMSPAFFAASIYMLVGRAMLYVGHGYSIIRPSWITPIFVSLDVVAICSQGGGSGIMFGGSSTLDRIKLGRNILIVGLFIQLIAFVAFLFLTISFDIKTRRALGQHVASLRPLLNVFYFSGALILLRSVYRAIEFMTIDFGSYPLTGYFYNVEWSYYVLDAIPIAIAVLAYNIWFPAKYLPKSKEERLGIKEDGATMLNNSSLELRQV